MSELSEQQRSGRTVLRWQTAELLLEVVPSLGGTITSLRRTGDETSGEIADVLWSTPWGLRPPGTALPGTPEAVAHDTYAGGWQPILPNGSDGVTIDGVEWPHDGEARLAWCEWESGPSSLRLRTRLLRTPLELARTISVRGAEVTVGETVRNAGSRPVDVVWGQQIALAAAFASPGAVLDAGASLVHADPWTSTATYDDLLPWPRAYAGDAVVNLRAVPDGPYTRRAYLAGFASPRLSVRRPDLGVGVELEWDGDAWPYAWYELETGGAEDYPWFGRARFLRLTPCSGWPARGLHEVRRTSGTQRRIRPGETLTSHLSVRIT